ncbi:MAG: CHC2 zinc finger domain-containing protein [Peptostreptococcaceae bacterium]
MKAVKKRIVTDITILERELKSYGIEGRKATKCPFCPSHDALYIKVNNNTFKCFSCGEQGNVIDLVMRKEGLSFMEALKNIANRYGIELPNKEYTPEEKAKYKKRIELEKRRTKAIKDLESLKQVALSVGDLDSAFLRECEIEEVRNYSIEHIVGGTN